MFVDFTCKLDKSVILSYFFSIYVQKSEIGHYLNRVVEHHNICISNRSKLRVERTRNSLARNLWVLRVQRYAACTQRVMCVLARVCNIIKQKSSPFRCNGTTFAFHLSLSCTAFCCTFAFQKYSFCTATETYIIKKWWRTVEITIKTPSEFL